MTDVRDASTLILVAGSDLACDPPKVLTIIRASNLNYLPDALVFPGGNFDKNDEHVDWLSIIPIEEQNVNLNSKISSTAQVSRALSSRITAIRETFEECCILLCKRYNDPKISKVTPLFINDSKRWRQKIRTNSYEFLNLCRSYRCYPDVRGLYFISTWITPPHFTRRYNCKFFAAVTDYVVDGDIDTTEVQSMEWQPFINCNKNKQIFIPPAQLYELSKFEKFRDINSFLNFVKKIDGEECEIITSVHVYAKDGYIFLLPGDEKYDHFRATNTHQVETDKTVKSFRSNIMRRLEYQPSYHPTEVRKVVIKNYPKYNSDSSALIKTKL